MEPNALEYWLSRCEGFRVDSTAGRLGVVEQVVFGARPERADALVVRAGLFGSELMLVPVEEVEDVRPRELRLRLRPAWRPPGRDFLTHLIDRLRSLVPEGPGREGTPVPVPVPASRRRR